MNDDITVHFVLDRLDFEPTLIKGFTATELMIASGASIVFWCGVWVPVMALIGKAMVGVGIGFLFTLVTVAIAAGRVEVLKRGRPSYLLWVDLKRRIQFRGILGIKINFRMIGTSNWDVVPHGGGKK